jgi:hypothetical protein
MTFYTPVTIRPGCSSIDAIYGASPATGWIWMPVGETGQEIMARSKQSEADKRECIKRGAE